MWAVKYLNEHYLPKSTLKKLTATFIENELLKQSGEFQILLGI